MKFGNHCTATHTNTKIYPYPQCMWPQLCQPFFSRAQSWMFFLDSKKQQWIAWSVFRRIIFFPLTHLVLPHYFPGSFRTVALLYRYCLQYFAHYPSLSVFHLKEEFQNLYSCVVHVCLWLLKGFTFWLIQCKAVHYCSDLIAACLNSLRPLNTLHFAFVSHNSIPGETRPRRWMFRQFKHGSKSSISVLIYVKWFFSC